MVTNPQPTPPKPAQTGNFPKRMSRQALVTAVVLVGLALALGAYALNNRSDENTSPTNSSTPTTVNNTGGSQTVVPTGEKLTFKELGVSIILPDALKDLKYAAMKPPAQFKSAPTILNLTLNSYSKIANKCLGTAASMVRPFATLTRSNSTSSPPGMENLKQFDSFFIANLGSSVPKGTKCKATADQKSFDELSSSLNSALKTAFSSAKQVK